MQVEPCGWRAPPPPACPRCCAHATPSKDTRQIVASARLRSRVFIRPLLRVLYARERWMTKTSLSQGCKLTGSPPRVAVSDNWAPVAAKTAERPLLTGDPI